MSCAAVDPPSLSTSKWSCRARRVGGIRFERACATALPLPELRVGAGRASDDTRPSAIRSSDKVKIGIVLVAICAALAGRRPGAKIQLPRTDRSQSDATPPPPNRLTTQRCLLEGDAGTNGGTDGYPNVCRTCREDPSARFGLGDTTDQREVESLGLAGRHHRKIQLFRRPIDLKFDRRTSQVGFRTTKNARIPEIRGRQRAAPNRQCGGRN